MSKNHHENSKQCSGIAFSHAKTTFANRNGKNGETVLDIDGAFANIVRIGNQHIGITSDGIGTKIEIAERAGIYNTLGYDLVAMVADDLAAMGIEPTNISNILDVNTMVPETIEELMKGLASAAQYAGMSITGGEIAELGTRIGGYGTGMHFNWCSTAIGVAGEHILSGRTIQAGDTVIALAEDGFRSNGYTLARKTLERCYGMIWHQEKFTESQTWAEALLTPSKIYCPLINNLKRANVVLHGASHITGGGVPANLGRVLKANKLGADISNLFSPPRAMQAIVRMADVSERDAYTHWNMGNGFLIIAPSESVDATLGMAATMGYRAQVAGTINTNTAQVRIGKTLYENPGK